MQALHKDIWFVMHVTFMSMSILFTVTAYIVIAVQVGFFPYDSEFLCKNPHPVTGLVCILLMFGQLFMALCR